MMQPNPSILPILTNTCCSMQRSFTLTLIGSIKKFTACMILLEVDRHHSPLGRPISLQVVSRDGLKNLQERLKRDMTESCVKPAAVVADSDE